MKIPLMCIGLALAFSTSASAAFIDGNELHEACTGPDEIQGEGQFCVGYAIGVFDTLDGSRSVCVPREVKLTQVHDVIVKYLVEHPEERHKPASFLAYTALNEAFPC